VAAVDLGEAVGHHVGIPDRAFDAPVPEKLLDVPYAGAVFKEVRGGGMAQGVRRYFALVHVKAPEEFAEAFAHAARGQVPAGRRAAEDPGVGLISIHSVYQGR
jgi:hypothetical protein